MSDTLMDTVRAAGAGAAPTSRDILRFLTCGSVDDGKSTLIGRLLFDSQLVLEDQLSALERDSRASGTVPDGLDLALMLDGLEAEREQGITIDVAYRYFGTARRKFIVADTPGHEQYTRNMVTGASNCDLAVILVDARKGLLPQTRRHSYIVSLIGIGHVVLAVNKMDLVDFDQARFEEIAGAYRSLAQGLGVKAVTCIPVSALKGDNVVKASDTMDWWTGPTLLGFLEGVEPPVLQSATDFRMPVQWVNRPNSDFRGYCGRVAAGRIAPGDTVTALPSRRTSRIARIVTHDGDLAEASRGHSVTLTLADEIDVSRGDMIVAGTMPDVADQFAARLVWMSEDPLLPGRRYLLKSGTQTVPASVTAIRHKVNIETYEDAPARQLTLNDIGLCTLSTDKPLVFEPYGKGGELGAFILIDRLSNATVGAGMIQHALRRATNITWQNLEIDRKAHAGLKSQTPCVLWFTGLSGAGKSTVANIVERKLHAEGHHTFLLDGDNVRHGLNRDLGFTAADRVENIRRVAEVAKLMTDAGLIVLVSLISPFRNERRMARETMAENEFFEVFVDAPLEVCETRDPKGLYRRARAGDIPNFTGIDSPYEPPEHAEIVVRSDQLAPDEAADRIIAALADHRSG